MFKTEFVYEFVVAQQQCTLRVPLSLPLQGQTIGELASRLTSMHKLPCYLQTDLLQKLKSFTEHEIRQFEDAEGEAALERLRNGVEEGALVAEWTNAYSQEVIECAKQESISNDVMFSEIYHCLIHSPALEALLNLEHTYAIAVSDVIARRDQDLLHLEQRQESEMEEAVKRLGETYTDEQINLLAQRHFENTQMIESKWASELSTLRDTQKREYRDWVMDLHEDSEEAVPKLNDSLTAEQSPRREESFTVHLGAQLKTMHNLRLVSADVLSFCRHKTHVIEGVTVPQPQRLQTAISLYSNSLCGLILLVDNRLNSYTGIKRDFAGVCEQSTDFHFPDLELQFQSMEESVMRGNEKRAQQRLTSSTEDADSLQSGASSGSERDDRALRLNPGDFYTSRHSNLSEAHVVFHLVADDSVRSLVSDISSRHPVIMGIRNVLKACFRYDVHTLTLPLLLVHEMSEEMTIPWCMKRAELVLKCVKGFMMELATYSGQGSRTVQFLVPNTLSADTFASISAMVSSIFRMSNPVIAKS
ncbi:hypothetical protein CAPTEDRAFT_117173 [Capitella teleta]|uniref:Uncharacterized protein n=1 Tax=Capitella teleta TaxID=283909 RepID=R7VA97_CAPTE|nr:hypothetical protein CAPTEDRAFT_117173 [Capitella teleta]|eukprot:ELU15738.1 hypothetical protein CAPTEDRAFT_117173 [Capitella teleta]